VLAGVHDQLLAGLSETPRDRRRLHELRPVADDCQYTHARILSPAMARKLLGGAFSALTIAAGAVRHVAWYVGHQLGGEPRDKED
jgi:hypothetical protein